MKVYFLQIRQRYPGKERRTVKLTPQQYDAMIQKTVPATQSGRTIPAAFLVGGLICMLGQGLTDLYKLFLDQQQASTLASVTLVFLSALTTGLGLYPKLAKFAGAGTLVPITGFSNAVTSPALEFKSEGFVLGLGAKLFTLSGPVIVYGIVTSILYGVLYYFTGLGG
ncbi:MAG TPA: stage V sporulation protein AC [Candidatus Egerieicola pullicola]|uniref:Stage V sporulation protein AC n=1 Tax=Candidatus Egerieicola pullicola TaxID=2840775 RepID=A0A9D1DC77_9FIRM|nr:stage V sporulation protein AC [Candidatus Egerieicola pullicola]